MRYCASVLPRVRAGNEGSIPEDWVGPVAVPQLKGKGAR